MFLAQVTLCAFVLSVESTTKEMINELTWQEAEEKFKVRLDRRRSYASDGRQLFELSRWTDICYGCAVLGCTDTGCGCKECGYTGRKRWAVWSPWKICEAVRKGERKQEPIRLYLRPCATKLVIDLCQGGPGTHDGRRWVRGGSCDFYVLSRRVPPIEILFPYKCSYEEA
jgi:hypothetical protein